MCSIDDVTIMLYSMMKKRTPSLLKKSVCVRERQGQRDEWCKQTDGGLLYWHFLNPSRDSIFRDLHLYFLDERFSTRSRLGANWPCAVGSAQRSFCPDSCGSNWLTVTHWLTCVCRIWKRLSIPVVLPAVNPSDLLTPMHHLLSGNPFVYTAGTSCPRNPWLTALWKVSMQ